MDWIKMESVGLACPALADELIRSEALEWFEAAAEVVSGDIVTRSGQGLDPPLDHIVPAASFIGLGKRACSFLGEYCLGIRLVLQVSRYHMHHQSGIYQGDFRHMNAVRTGLLLAALTGLFLAVGYLLGREQGMVIAFILAAGLNLFSYWNADKMVLRMHGAQQVDRRSAPDFFALVEDLARRGGLPMPKVYVMDNPQPNAFATGRNPENSAVAATTGLLNLLDRDEIAGVMAHELAHIRNRDTLIMTLTATIAGAISMIANLGMLFGGSRNRDNPMGVIGVIALVILAPLGAMIVQMAISRTREYGADRGGAEISGNPRALASALSKISGAVRHIENPAAEANPATAHMFIVNPLSGHRMDNLFSTHPDPQNRIDMLMRLAAELNGKYSSETQEIDSHRRRGPWG